MKLTYRHGFDWGDMGLYAQTIYAMRQGANPTDFLGYGPLWYNLGEIASLGRPIDYGTLLRFMQGVVALSAALIFSASYLATRSAIAAAAATACFILVPPFSAYAIRSIVLGLFLVPFVALARSPRDRETLPLVLTALATSLVFQIRPDFGYLYAALTFILIVARNWNQHSDRKADGVAIIRHFLWFFAVFLAGLVPILITALARGYLGDLLSDFASYPRSILFYLVNAGGVTDMVTSSDQQQAAFMRILPISAMFGADGRERLFAFMIYSTTGMMALLASIWAWSALRSRHKQPDFVLLALLLVAAVQWPYFALSRPSWIHFVAFAHAYAVLLAYVAARAWPAIWLRRGVARAMAIILVVVALVQGLGFVRYGVSDPSTSWLTLRAGRDQTFKADSGVSLVLSQAEKAQYGKIFRTVQANSAPGDAMVCVPYCAGFIFMNGRRMLFTKQAFVDDATPRKFPGWIDLAIATTRKERPAAIIVLDWAPNNTAASRFDVWAKRYMDYVRSQYHPVPFAMGTIWLREKPKAPMLDANSVSLRVVRFGPESTPAGTAFNRQPDGSSAIWMELSAPVGPDATLYFDDKPLKTVVNGAIVTALVPAELIADPGTHQLRVIDDAQNIFAEPVTLVVQ